MIPAPTSDVAAGQVMPRAVIAVTEHDLRYAGWGVALASAAGVYVGFASLFVYTFGIFLKPFAEEFGWSRQAISTGFGIAAMSVAFASPLLGSLLDRIGPRRVIVPCLLVFGTAFASFGLLTPHLWHFYLVCFALGVVGNGTAQMAYSRSVASWFAQRRGLALALMMCGGAIGAMTLPPLAQALIDRFGWRTACMALGLGAMTIGVPLVLRWIRERPTVASGEGAHAAGASVADGLRSWVFWVLVTVLFFASISQNGALAHLAALLTDRGVPASGAAVALAAMGGAGLVGRLVTGWLLDRFFAGYVSFALLALAASGVFLLAGAHSLPMGIAAAMLIGFGMGGEADVTPYLLSRYFGLRSFATLYGFTWTAFALAGALGPILMGRAFDLTGSYERLLITLALGTLVVGSLMLIVPRYGRAGVVSL